MRLYSTKMAPYPRRVSIYLAEKGLEIGRVEVDIMAMAHKSPEFLKINPAGKVPVLELSNGDYLPESGAIVEYLEELHPNPPMFGDTAEARAQTRATERIADQIFLGVSASAPCPGDRPGSHGGRGTQKAATAARSPGTLRRRTELY